MLLVLRLRSSCIVNVALRRTPGQSLLDKRREPNSCPSQHGDRLRAPCLAHQARNRRCVQMAERVTVFHFHHSQVVTPGNLTRDLAPNNCVLQAMLWTGHRYAVRAVAARTKLSWTNVELPKRPLCAVGMHVNSWPLVQAQNHIRCLESAVGLPSRSGMHGFCVWNTARFGQHKLRLHVSCNLTSPSQAGRGGK